MKTVSEWLRRAALVRGRCASPSEDEQRDDRFLALMLNRLTFGVHRYHDLQSPLAPRYDHVRSAIKRLETYLDDGNLEHLVDAANFCLLEFVRAPFGRGSHPNPSWHPVDDGDHTAVLPKVDT